MSGDRTVLEAAARAMSPSRWDEGDGCFPHRRDLLIKAKAALSAAGFSEEQMQQPAGSVVVAPVEPTQEMLVAAYRVDDAAYAGGSQHGATDEDIWHAMIAARPGSEG